MLAEFALGLLEGNLSYLAGLILGNLHWLFVFAAMMKIQNPEKPWIKATLLFILFMFGMRDVMGLFGWIPMPILSPLFFFGIIIMTVRIFIAKTWLEKWTFPLTVSLVFLTSGIANFLTA